MTKLIPPASQLEINEDDMTSLFGESPEDDCDFLFDESNLPEDKSCYSDNDGASSHAEEDDLEKVIARFYQDHDHDNEKFPKADSVLDDFDELTVDDDLKDLFEDTDGSNDPSDGTDCSMADEIMTELAREVSPPRQTSPPRAFPHNGVNPPTQEGGSMLPHPLSLLALPPKPAQPTSRLALPKIPAMPPRPALPPQPVAPTPGDSGCDNSSSPGSPASKKGCEEGSDQETTTYCSSHTCSGCERSNISRDRGQQPTPGPEEEGPTFEERFAAKKAEAGAPGPKIDLTKGEQGQPIDLALAEPSTPTPAERPAKRRRKSRGEAANLTTGERDAPTTPAAALLYAGRPDVRFAATDKLLMVQNAACREIYPDGTQGGPAKMALDRFNAKKGEAMRKVRYNRKIDREMHTGCALRLQQATTVQANDEKEGDDEELEWDRWWNKIPFSVKPARRRHTGSTHSRPGSGRCFCIARSWIVLAHLAAVTSSCMF